MNLKLNILNVLSKPITEATNTDYQLFSYTRPGNNMTQIRLNNKYIYLSYDTVVAVEDKKTKQAYMAEKRYSNTTQKHKKKIEQELLSSPPEIVPEIDFVQKKSLIFRKLRGRSSDTFAVFNYSDHVLVDFGTIYLEFYHGFLIYYSLYLYSDEGMTKGIAYNYLNSIPNKKAQAEIDRIKTVYLNQPHQEVSLTNFLPPEKFYPILKKYF